MSYSAQVALSVPYFQVEEIGELTTVKFDLFIRMTWVDLYIKHIGCSTDIEPCVVNDVPLQKTNAYP